MLDKINSLKGYMPLHEGEALAKWAEKFSKVGPILEIGTFGGKSAAFLAYGSKKMTIFLALAAIHPWWGNSRITACILGRVGQF